MGVVIRQGRSIEVATVETGAQQSKVRRREADLFVKLPLQWAVAANKATRTPKALAWVLLHHIAWQTNSMTFPLPNGTFKRYGVRREAKRRTLMQLEAAGLIAVKRRYNRAPIVTLIGV